MLRHCFRFQQPQNESENSIGVSYLHILRSLSICWKQCIKSPFTFLRSVSQCMCARACEWVRCQSKRRLLFHLYSQSEIRGRRTALHSLQPNITLSLCWAHFWRGTPFYPRNQTGMTHSIWSPALFFFFWVGFFEQSELPCVQLILLTFASKNTTGVVLELLKHPASLHCGPLWILECCRRPNTRTRVWSAPAEIIRGFSV